MCAPTVTPCSAAAAQVAAIVRSSPAWNPHATFALVTMRISSSSVAQPSPRSAFRSTTMRWSFSARALQLLDDLLRGARVRVELLQGALEQLPRAVVVAVAEHREAEVRDHLALVTLVVEVVEDRERLLEALDGGVGVTGGVEGEREAVEGRRFAAAVA